MSRRPTPEQVREFLHAWATQVPDDDAFWISGYRYSEQDALNVAETCLLTGQDQLTAVVSSSMMLEQARRIADLEDRLDQLNEWASMCPDLRRMAAVRPPLYDTSPPLPPEPQPFRNGA